MAISDIDPASPSGNDLVLNGDDEIRALKQNVKESFAGINAPVYEDADNTGQGGSTPVSAATMSSWEARIKALEQLALSPDGTSIPVGGVIAWYGDVNTIPTGFKVCDGSTYEYTDGEGNPQTITVPDLRGKVIAGVGAGGVNWNATPTNVFTNGVMWVNTNTTGAHSHGTVTPGHALTTAELPTHYHAMFTDETRSISGSPPLVNFLEYVAAGLLNPSGSQAYAMVAGSGGSPQVGLTGGAGSGNSHTHPSTVTSTTGNHDHITDCTVPYRGLYYICYVAV